MTDQADDWAMRAARGLQCSLEFPEQLGVHVATIIRLEAEPELSRLRALNAELAEALKAVRYELSALIPRPEDPDIGDWPCDNPADQGCLQNAYASVIAALAKAQGGPR